VDYNETKCTKAKKINKNSAVLWDWVSSQTNKNKGEWTYNWVTKLKCLVQDISKKQGNTLFGCPYQKWTQPLATLFEQNYLLHQAAIMN